MTIPFRLVETVSSSICLAIATLSVSLRLWARAMRNKRYDAGDYLVVLALVREHADECRGLQLIFNSF